MSTLDDYKKGFATLKVGRQGDEISPHKPCLLLAVIEYAARGALLPANRINIYNQPSIVDPTLVEIFERYVNAVKPGNPARIANPLLRLKSSKFWHLQPKPGRDIGKPPANGGDDPKFLKENAEFAYLDEELRALLMDERNRKELINLLIDTWFPDRRAAVEAVINTGQQEFEYEQKAVRNPVQIEEPTVLKVSEKIRGAAFRRGVLDAYDHSCAATGDRFLMLGSLTLLEAAHIRPFSESYDDRIVNGMALSPTYHRAMDRHLIAPGPDLVWHVSSTLDKRLGGDRKLLELEGEKILVPRKKDFLPAAEVLEWRLEKFREVDRQR